MYHTELQPQEIRDEFACFCDDEGIRAHLLSALFDLVGTDTLAQLMDDL